MVTTIGSNVTLEWFYATCVMPLVLCHLCYATCVMPLAPLFCICISIFFIGNFQGQSNILVLKFTSSELMEEMW